MNCIALETTEKSASVAIFKNERMIYCAQLPTEVRSAQSLAPGLKQALTQTGLEPTQIGLVAVAQGPGSFTGLRVGVVSAKTFAWAVNADIIGVDSMEICGGTNKPLKFIVYAKEKTDKLTKLSDSLEEAFMRYQYATMGIDYDSIKNS